MSEEKIMDTLADLAGQLVKLKTKEVYAESLEGRAKLKALQRLQREVNQLERAMDRFYKKHKDLIEKGDG